MGFRFKLANFIMGDYLRNYLVVGVRLPLLKVLDSKVDPYTAHLIKKALKTTEEIFKIQFWVGRCKRPTSFFQE